jgi:predicted nucleic acid-binding protein
MAARIIEAGIIIDTNVIIDLLVKDKNWFGWSSEMLSKYKEDNDLIINPIIYSELAYRFISMLDLDQRIAESSLTYEELPREAAFLAGKCYSKYKKEPQSKGMILPDFYIGAHAVVTKRPVLTRDSRRYSAHYFSNLQVITPESVTA